MMGTTTKTITVAAMMLALAGCSTAPAEKNTEPAPVVTVTETAPAPEPPAEPVDAVEEDLDGEFIYDIELYEERWRAYGSEDQIIQLGTMACEYFEAGGTLEGYVDITEESNLSSEFAITVAAAAISNYCPELEDQVIGE